MSRPVLAALAVVVEDGRVLLVRRSNQPDAGLWGFPGGKVEFGEPVFDAAARELGEETGLTCQPQRFLTIVDVIGGTDQGPHHYALAAVLCQRLSGEPVAADDAADARWFAIADVLDGQLPTSERVADVVSLALEHTAASAD